MLLSCDVNNEKFKVGWILLKWDINLPIRQEKNGDRKCYWNSNRYRTSIYSSGSKTERNKSGEKEGIEKLTEISSK